jgi:hypothetical protein
LPLKNRSLKSAALRPVDADDAEKGPSRYFEAPAVARRHRHLPGFAHGFARAPIQLEIRVRQLIDLVTYQGLNGSSRGRVGGGLTHTCFC